MRRYFSTLLMTKCSQFHGNHQPLVNLHMYCSQKHLGLFTQHMGGWLNGRLGCVPAFAEAFHVSYLEELNEYFFTSLEWLFNAVFIRQFVVFIWLYHYFAIIIFSRAHISILYKNSFFLLFLSLVSTRIHTTCGNHSLFVFLFCMLYVRICQLRMPFQHKQQTYSFFYGEKCGIHRNEKKQKWAFIRELIRLYFRTPQRYVDEARRADSEKIPMNGEQFSDWWCLILLTVAH